jgi:GNAT superfamily N-acetyltransferase
MKIRLATPSDIPAIKGLIEDLAEYEQAREEAIATDDDLHRALFGENPHVFCHVAEIDGVLGGLALWFLNYSTWHGAAGLYLEDLYVRESHRGEGVGTALMKVLAQLCVERGYTRFQWWVLDWNTPSIEFYESIGAIAMDEWTVFRLSGDALNTFASASATGA